MQDWFYTETLKACMPVEVRVCPCIYISLCMHQQSCLVQSDRDQDYLALQGYVCNRYSFQLSHSFYLFIYSFQFQIVRSSGGADMWGLYAKWHKIRGDLMMCSEALLKQVRSYQVFLLTCYINEQQLLFICSYVLLHQYL